MTKHAKKQYYLESIKNCDRDAKCLFNLANKLLFRKKPLPLPKCDDNNIFADNFNNFFEDKISKIMEKLTLTENNMVDNNYIEEIYHTNQRHHKFVMLNVDEVRKLVLKSASRCCELDPMPTQLLKQNIEIVLPTITKKINIPLLEGKFTTNLKEALLRSLLKKMGLETILSKYCPVSNLSYISKLIEMAACDQIVHLAESSGSTELMQSAYRAGHSCKTALLKVKTDILHAMDNHEVICLVMLDLSVAFDTVSHFLHLNRLEHHFGIKGKKLHWIKYYLVQQTQ